MSAQQASGDGRQELGVVAHELMHKHGQAVLGAEGWAPLHAVIGGWASAPEGSLERRVHDEAAARVQALRPEGADAGAYASQELFPYAVQVATELGVRPHGLAPQGSAARWLAQVRAALRQVWNQVAGSRGDFNALDLVNLAFGIAQRENPAFRVELDAATAERLARAARTLQQISEAGDLFALPKSRAKTVEGIAAEVDPRIDVQRLAQPDGETRYNLSLPDGSHAAIFSREPTPREWFGIEDSGRWITERPGEDAPPVGARSDVWVSVLDLQPGQMGGVIYNIAAAYAHNTGRIFIGDPAGLSDLALRRRAEQMLSSALKFGTTDHIAPHPRQVAGDAALGVPPLRWVYGDHEGNIGRLVDVNLRALENAYPEAKNLAYDLDSGNFIDQRTGRITSREALSRSAHAGGRSRGEQEAGAGWRTLARGSVFRALLQGARGPAEGGGPGAGGESGPVGGQVLDGRVRQPSQHDSARERGRPGHGGLLAGLAAERERLASVDDKQRIFYSRRVAAKPSAREAGR